MNKSDQEPGSTGLTNTQTQAHTTKRDVGRDRSSATTNAANTNSASLADNPGEQGKGGKSTDDAGKTQKRLDPTRYGDWEKNGRCIDF